MPALRFLGRRWHIAADDLPFPSLLGAAWHVALSVLIAVELSYAVQYIDGSCYYRRRSLGYLATHLGCVTVNSILHTATYYHSIKGSLFQVSQRRYVGPLVLAVIVFYTLTIANNIYGTHLLYLAFSVSACEPLPGAPNLNARALLKTIVVATWVSLFTGFLAMLATLNLFTTYKAASSPWHARCNICRALCCWCLVPRSRGGAGSKGAGGGGGRAASGDEHGGADEDSLRGLGDRSVSPMVVIADIFTHIFGKVDMTFTDYVAAFTLLGLQHRHAKPAHAYGSARAPDWLEHRSQGQLNGKERSDEDPLALQPPQVVELAASDRPGRRADSDGWSNGARSGEGGTAPAPCGVARGAEGPTHPQQQQPVPATLADGTDPSSASPTDTTTTTSVPNGLETTTNDTLLKPSAAAAATVATLVSEDAAAGAQPNGGTKNGVAPGQDQHPRPGPQSGSGLPDELAWSGTFAESNASPEVMEEAVHYLQFATAVYGWKMYLWMHRLDASQCCKLCLGRKCGCCRQSTYFLDGVGPDTGPSEGCCSAGKLLEREAITQLTRVPEEDILYVCYDNQVGGLLPYYIALDRSRQSIVVGIRGSMSLSDVITDLVCAPAEYDVPGVPSVDSKGRRVMWAHRGMVGSTTAIWRDILEQGVLDGALAEWPADGSDKQLHHLKSKRAQSVAMRLQGSCVGWRVVVTGHSLGGGVTGLLGPLLATRYANLRCWAFAPPGGLMSPKAAELSRGHCISVIHAKDMIPRLAIGTMEQMVQRLVAAGVRCRVSKAHVMGRLVAMGERPEPKRLFCEPGDIPPELRYVLENYDNRLQGTPSAKVGLGFHAAADFEPPGHLLYVERRKRHDARPDATCCCLNLCMTDTSGRRADYACRWIQAKDLLRGGLLVSRSMFLDHLPDNTLRAMQLAHQQLKAAQEAARTAAPLPTASATCKTPPEPQPATSKPRSPAGIGNGHGMDRSRGTQPPSSDHIAIAVSSPLIGTPAPAAQPPVAPPNGTHEPSEQSQDTPGTQLRCGPVARGGEGSQGPGEAVLSVA